MIRTLRIVASLVALVSFGCAGDTRPQPSASQPTTSRPTEPGYARPRVVGRLQVPALAELSGLTAATEGDVLWAHNDSGGEPTLYCMTLRGSPCGRWSIGGAEMVDWEDIAAGRDPDRRALYIADTGDNEKSRDSVTIYRVDEPAGPGSGTLSADAFHLEYPDRPHDVEAIVVAPGSGDLYAITKEIAGRALVFAARAPLRSGSRFERVTTLDIAGPVAIVTGASLSFDGERVALATYRSGYEFRLPAGSPFDEIWEQAPTPIDLGSRPQGEAIAYTRDGDLISASEGAGTPLYGVEYLARP